MTNNTPDQAPNQKKKPSQILGERAQQIQQERQKLDAELIRIQQKIGSLDKELDTILTDVVACL